MRLMLAVLLAVFVLAAQPADAKCAPSLRVFSGVVTDKLGKPIPGAMVGIAWSEYDGPTGPALSLTDRDGRYRISILFETYSGKGSVAEDECKQRLEVVSLSAFKGSLRSPYQQVRIAEGEDIRLPAAVIWLDAQEPTMLRYLKPSR